MSPDARGVSDVIYWKVRRRELWRSAAARHVWDDDIDHTVNVIDRGRIIARGQLGPTFSGGGQAMLFDLHFLMHKSTVRPLVGL